MTLFSLYLPYESYSHLQYQRKRAEIGFDDGKKWSCWCIAATGSSAARGRAPFWTTERSSLYEQVVCCAYRDRRSLPQSKLISLHIYYFSEIKGTIYKKGLNASQTRREASLLKFWRWNDVWQRPRLVIWQVGKKCLCTGKLVFKHNNL